MYTQIIRNHIICFRMIWRRIEELEENLYVPDGLLTFWEASKELDHAYTLFSKSCGLSDAAYWSLLSISEGAVTQSQISDQLYFSRQTLNSAFKQLQKNGLIRLETCEGNQRSKQAFLTEKGKDFVEKYVVQMYQAEERAWNGLNREEQEALTRLTRKFSGLIQKELQKVQEKQTD